MHSQVWFLKYFYFETKTRQRASITCLSPGLIPMVMVISLAWADDWDPALISGDLTKGSAGLAELPQEMRKGQTAGLCLLLCGRS